MSESVQDSHRPYIVGPAGRHKSVLANGPGSGIALGAKSEQKKRYIIETAGKVFAAKGFKNVTMKDIAIACDISRGGLYLYYPDTSHLLEDVLRNEELHMVTASGCDTSSPEQASKLLNLFLHKQKKALFSVEDDLSIAAYEYAFAEDGTDYLRGRFEQVVDQVEEILRMGVESGEFHCTDPHKAALSIMFTLEGLKISSRTIGLSETEAEEEMRFVVRQLTNENAEPTAGKPGEKTKK